MDIPAEYVEAGYETFREGLKARFPNVPITAIELASYMLVSIALDGNQDSGATKHLISALDAMNTPD